MSHTRKTPRMNPTTIPYSHSLTYTTVLPTIHGMIVGHLPVLSSGNVVEYMSGCHLTTMQGKMEGMLHMAVVDNNTPHAYLGDHIEALQPWFPGVKLNVPVASFNLQPPLE